MGVCDDAETSPITDAAQMKEYWKAHVYYCILDKVIGSLKKRFSPENMKMAIAVDNFIALDYENSKDFIDFYNPFLKTKLPLLKSEMLVCQNCYTNSYPDDKSIEVSKLMDLLEKIRRHFLT